MATGPVGRAARRLPYACHTFCRRFADRYFWPERSEFAPGELSKVNRPNARLFRLVHRKSTRKISGLSPRNLRGARFFHCATRGRRVNLNPSQGSSDRSGSQRPPRPRRSGNGTCVRVPVGTVAERREGTGRSSDLKGLPSVAWVLSEGGMSSDVQPVNRECRKADPAQEGVRPVSQGTMRRPRLSTWRLL
jgi:hypothetical protein